MSWASTVAQGPPGAPRDGSGAKLSESGIREQIESNGRLLTGYRSVAEDIAQEAFVATQRRWAAVENPAPYVRAAVVNRSRLWLRRRALEERHSEPDDGLVELGADELWDALEVLTERQRTAVVLRYWLLWWAREHYFVWGRVGQGPCSVR